VYDGKSATSVEEVKRFSATKINRKNRNRTKRNKTKKGLAKQIQLALISICTQGAEKAQ
jgi:hypothetical protein